MGEGGGIFMGTPLALMDGSGVVVSDAGADEGGGGGGGGGI